MTEQPPVDTTNPERPAPGTPEYALLMFDEGEDRDFVRTLSTEFEEISQEEVEQRVVALQQLAEQHFEAVRSEALKVNEAGSKMLSGTVSVILEIQSIGQSTA